MTNYRQTLEFSHPGTQYTIDGDPEDYASFVEWLEPTPKPTQAELDADWNTALLDRRKLEVRVEAGTRFGDVATVQALLTELVWFVSEYVQATMDGGVISTAEVQDLVSKVPALSVGNDLTQQAEEIILQLNSMTQQELEDFDASDDSWWQ